MTAGPTLSVWPVAQTPSRAQRADRYLPESIAHPGRMLPELARRAVQSYSAPGDLVLDPMCGIGTTLVEAIELERDAVGVELDAHWASVAASNVVRARGRGAGGRAIVQPGEARALGRGTLDALAGSIDLILTSPPYGKSVHGHVRPQARRVEKFYDRYSADPTNLANLPAKRATKGRSSFGDALRDVLASCARMLAAGGHLVLTVRPYRRDGVLVDLPGQVIALAQRSGLVLRARHAALLCAVRDGGLLPRPSFFQLRIQRSGSVPRMLLIAHEDVLVFQPGASRSIERLRSVRIHGLIDAARDPKRDTEQSGPAALERPGPGTEGSASMQANRSPQASKKAAPTKAKPNSADVRPARREPREGSVMWAAIQILQGRRKPMTAGEIYAEISKRELASSLKGKTPEQTVAATLAVAAKHGRHVERAEPGKFRLRAKS